MVRFKTIDFMLYLFSLSMVIVVYYCLQFDINSIDEKFYTSLPYRFSSGDRFFLDEYNVAQTASLFTFFIYKIYLYLFSSSDGIFLFARHLYFFVSLFFVWLTYDTFKQVVPKSTALLLSLPCIIYVPLHIHTLGYTTQAMFFVMGANFFGLRAVFQGKRKEVLVLSKFTLVDAYVFLSAIFYSVALVSYPTILILPVLYLCILLIFMPRYRTLWFFSLPMALIGTLVAIMLLRSGIESLLIDYRYSFSLGSIGGYQKIITNFFAYWLNYLPHKEILLFLFFMAVIVKNKYKFILPLISIITLIILVIPAYHVDPYFLRETQFITNISFIAPFLYLLVLNKKSKFVDQFFVLVWIPSFIAGIIFSWSSTFLVYNHILGAFSGAIVSIYYFIVLNEGAWSFNNKFMWFSRLDYLISPIFVVIVLQCYNVSFPFLYSTQKIDYKINSGPFSGIYTSRPIYKFYEQLKTDISTLTAKNNSILFFNDLPEGYFFTNMKPNTNTVWLFSGISKKYTLDYISRRKQLPEYIVKTLGVPCPPVEGCLCKQKYSNNDAYIITLISEKYKLLIQRKELYEIYQKI